MVDQDDTVLHPCARCARVQQTCCQRAEIVLTGGDLARVQAHTGRDDFWTLRAPADASYGVPDPDDPIWATATVRHDGRRRVLRRQGNGDCTFLGQRGCLLPEAARPLVCRLYPFTYTERGLTGVGGDYCPAGLLAPRGESMADVLGMSRRDAERWRRLLYEELRTDLRRERAAENEEP